MIHIKAVLHILGTLLLFLGAALILPAIVAFIYDESDAISFLITIAISVIMGLAVFFGAKSDQELRIKDGFLVVTFSWVLFAFIGALPFYISGYIPSYTDAFFETMSGFTTTGASILTNIEALPHGLLFWRSFTHWLGGM
jgi:trk system potassium uptake protein TrkH